MQAKRSRRKSPPEGTGPSPTAMEDKGETVRYLPRSRALGSPTDDLNRGIVRLLQEDGRMPYKEIAARLKISEGTVRNRVNRMRRSGMLSIVAVTDPTAIDYKADAMLGLKVAPAVTPETVATRLASRPEVVYILWVSGRYDLLVEVVCEGEKEDLARFLAAHIHNNTDIANVEVMSSLSMFKNQFLLKRHA